MGTGMRARVRRDFVSVPRVSARGVNAECSCVVIVKKMVLIKGIYSYLSYSLILSAQCTRCTLVQESKSATVPRPSSQLPSYGPRPNNKHKHGTLIQVLGYSRVGVDSTGALGTVWHRQWPTGRHETRPSQTQFLERAY